MQDVAAPVESADKPLFETVNVLDSSICTTDQLHFAVLKGGQQSYTAKIGSSTCSNSNINFNIVVPSLDNMISRTMYIEADLSYTITPTADLDAGDFTVNWGKNLCLAPFALQQHFQSVNLIVNNNSFSMDCQDVTDAILRTISKKTLREYADVCPVSLDEYYSYNDIPAGAVNSPFNAFEYSVDSKYGRCSYQVKINQAAAAAGTLSPAATVTVRCFEPLLISPLAIFAGKEDLGCMYGIQNMSLVVSLSSALKGFRAKPGLTGALGMIGGTVGDSTSQTANLYLQYATPHPSMQLPARNVLNYNQMQVFKKALPGDSGAVIKAATILSTPPDTGTGVQVTSNTFQLNQIPDYLWVYIKKANASRTITDSDSYLPITRLSITFNNTPNICSQMTRQQLYLCSKKNGINGSWPQFCGYSFTNAADVTDSANVIATSGLPVKLQMGSDINLISDALAPGSIGSFNLLVEATYWDNTVINSGAPAVGLANYELIILAQQSGMAVFQLGSASTYMGLLDKMTVLNTSQKPAYNHQGISRKYGSGWMSGLKSIFSALRPFLKPIAKAAASSASAAAKDKLRGMNNKWANTGVQAMENLGLGVSAGGVSGGKMRGRVM